MSQLGAFDPPRTLNKATAMAPADPSSTAAAPASTVLPAQAPATPTPTPKSSQGDPSNVGLSAAGPAESARSSDPQADLGPGSPSNLQQSGIQTHSPNINDPSKSILNNNGPSIGNPSDSDPHSNGSPSGNGVSTAGSPNDSPSINSKAINNDPASSAFDSDQRDSKSAPITSGLTSNEANSASAESQPVLQLQSIQVQPLPTEPQHDVNSIQTPGLGAQIFSALGLVAGPNTVMETNVPDSPISTTGAQTQSIETVANSWLTQVTVDGSPVQKDPGGAVVAAGQTVAQGSQATIAGLPISVGSNDVVIDYSAHLSLPSGVEESTPIQAGGNTVQTGPNDHPVVGGQTSMPGAKSTVAAPSSTPNAKVDETAYSLLSNTPIPLSIVVNGITTVLQPSSSVISIADQEFPLSQESPHTKTAGQPVPYIMAGQTITPGGGAITISSIPISLPINQPLSTNPAISGLTESMSQTRPTLVTLGSQVFTLHSSVLAIVGTTISAGAPEVSISGTVLSLQQDGSGLVIGSSTLVFGPSRTGAGLDVSGGAAISTEVPGNKAPYGKSSTATLGNASSSDPSVISASSPTTLSLQATNDGSFALVHTARCLAAVSLCVIANLVYVEFRG